MKKTYIILSAIIAIIIAVTCFMFCGNDDKKQSVYGDTAININKVELKGELYLYSEIIEDYAIERDKESRIWPFPDKQHAQMLIKCKRMSYVLPLVSVKAEYNGTTAIITLPEPVMMESEQALNNVDPYLSDDDNYWSKKSGKVKAMVDKKIADRFAKKDKKEKAMENAKNTLRALYESAGFKEVIFN